MYLDTANGEWIANGRGISDDRRLVNVDGMKAADEKQAVDGFGTLAKVLLLAEAKKARSWAVEWMWRCSLWNMIEFTILF